MQQGALRPESDALDGIIGDVWRRLGRGAKDRRSPLHTPVVANVDAGGLPSQRVMVLRAVDSTARTLRFHTDARSAKTVSIADGAPVSVLGYDAGAKLQFRLTGVGWIERSGETADAAWNQSTLFARRCYLADPAPGTPCPEPVSGLPEWVAGRSPEVHEVVGARPNFAVLIVEIDRVEWLYLAHEGHRRALFEHGEAGWRGHWLVP